MTALLGRYASWVRTFIVQSQFLCLSGRAFVHCWRVFVAPTDKALCVPMDELIEVHVAVFFAMLQLTVIVVHRRASNKLPWCILAESDHYQAMICPHAYSLIACATKISMLDNATLRGWVLCPKWQVTAVAATNRGRFLQQ